MKTLIIYASKTGTVKKCAALLAANLGAEGCELFDINSGEPELSGFDCCAVGSYIRMGVIDKKISSFLKRHMDELFSVKFGIFLCGCLEDKVSEAIVKNLNDDFLEHADCVEYFGGELHPESYGKAEKLFMKSVLKIASRDPDFKISEKILPDRITAFSLELSPVQRASAMDPKAN